jgi:hypothetical protein
MDDDNDVGSDEFVEKIMFIIFEDRTALKKSVAVRGGRQILEFNSTYLIISPESKENCFYHCLAYQTAVL